MGTTVPATAPRRHLLPSEIGGSRTAKAELPDLRNSENRDYRAESGQCLTRAQLALGWNNDQLADALKRDASQVRRWKTGDERIQLDAVMSVPDLFTEFAVAMCVLSSAIEVVREIRVRRSA